MMMDQRDGGRSTKLSVHTLNCKSKAGRMSYKIVGGFATTKCAPSDTPPPEKP